MTETMTAVVMTEHGPALAQRPVPQPGPDQVAVEATAWALNNADLGTEPDGRIPGYEFAGRVAAVGEGVDPGLVGTRVMGLGGEAFADVVIAHHRHLIATPDTLSDAEAAPLTTALITEHGAMLAGGLAAGATVLLTAATSGIALVGLQIAKAMGAGMVIGASRSAEREHWILEAGADTAVSGDIVAGVRDVTAGAGADLVLDHVGGDGLADAIAAARHGGAVVSVGRLGGASATVDLFALARSGVALRSVSYGFGDPEVIGRLIDGLGADVMPAVADGRVRAVIASRHRREDVADAFTALSEGGVPGKVVLTAS